MFQLHYCNRYLNVAILYKLTYKLCYLYIIFFFSRKVCESSADLANTHCALAVIGPFVLAKCTDND